MVDGGFSENLQAMSNAEQSFLKFQAAARIDRAKADGLRPLKSFSPGDLVFYWRKQVPAHQGDKSGFSWTSQFVGPARVLAVETRFDDKGVLRAGSIVWLHRAGRLLKAAPEQLRALQVARLPWKSFKGQWRFHGLFLVWQHTPTEGLMWILAEIFHRKARRRETSLFR